jgi:spore coat polysaccharide biosynthesis protein SpsF (cytidylyltransferase family)
MTVACIVQARFNSTRLPGKIMLRLPNGRLVIEEVLHRCKQIPLVDVVVAAIADDAASDVIVAPSLAAGAIVVRGSETDVLARYLAAAEQVGATEILRVTSDCPLIDPDLCGMVIQVRRETGVDYACNNMPATFFHGADCEAFTIDLLRQANEIGDDAYPENREGVDVWMRESPDVTRYGLTRNGPSQRYIRLTLDTPEDWTAICAEFPMWTTA